MRKDMIIWEETWSCAPSVIRALTSELHQRTNDEGLLRVPGNKQKVSAFPILYVRVFGEIIYIFVNIMI